MVVNTVNWTKSLNIKFSKDHVEQRKIALGFQKKSKANFANCVTCIDGMLVWTHCPNDCDCSLAQCGAKKILCSRKKKIGLNMQAVCNSRGRFLDIDIHHPGATSDYLCFMTLQLKKMISTPKFLYPGLVLYGDNTYVTCEY